jgi:hypothetical protein
LGVHIIVTICCRSPLCWPSGGASP